MLYYFYVILYDSVSHCITSYHNKSYHITICGSGCMIQDGTCSAGVVTYLQ